MRRDQPELHRWPEATGHSLQGQEVPVPHCHRWHNASVAANNRSFSHAHAGTWGSARSHPLKASMMLARLLPPIGSIPVIGRSLVIPLADYAWLLRCLSSHEKLRRLTTHAMCGIYRDPCDFMECQRDR